MRELIDKLLAKNLISIATADVIIAEHEKEKAKYAEDISRLAQEKIKLQEAGAKILQNVEQVLKEI